MKAATSWRPSILAALGAGLEYGDFVVYLLLAPYLGRVFFPPASTAATTLQSLSLFAVGYIARPLGGIVFGARGDRRGRKSTFVRTTGWMAMATFAMGCLPVYAQAGVAAPLLLVALRCIQGFSMGGELPGAITYVTEQAPASQRGRHCGVIAAGVSVGGIVAAAFLSVWTARLGDAAMVAWGWRVPFWCGGSLALMTQLMRTSLPESPMFNAAVSQPAITPLRTLWHGHRLVVVQGLAMAIFGTALVIFPLYAPTFFHNTFGYELADIYRATWVSMAFAVPATLLAGRLADAVGPRRQLIAVAWLWAVVLWPAFGILEQRSMVALYSFCLLWQVSIALVITSYWVVIATALPTAARYSGLGVCINGGFIVSGLLPAVFERFGQGGLARQVVPNVYVAVALVGALGAWRLSAARSTVVAATPRNMAANTRP